MGDTQKFQESRLSAQADMLYHCADCNYCVDAVWQERRLDHVCPTLSHHSPSLSYSGRGYMSLARALHEGAEFPLEDIADRVFTCTSCGNCERVCPIGLSPRNVNIALREILVENDAVPASVLSLKEQLVSSHKSPHNQAVLDTVNLLFIPGCDSSFEGNELGQSQLGQNQEEQLGFELVKALNPNSAQLGAPAKCCGAKLDSLGFAAEAAHARQDISEDINIYPHVEYIVLANPKCEKNLVSDARVTSLPAWLNEKLTCGDVQATPKGVLPLAEVMSTCGNQTWNTEVRELLSVLYGEQGLALSNDNASPLAMCCGAGGGLPEMAPDSATRMAAAKLQKYGDINSTLVVPDPGCLRHLIKANQSAEKISGLYQFLSEHFEFTRTGDHV